MSTRTKKEHVFVLLFTHRLPNLSYFTSVCHEFGTVMSQDTPESVSSGHMPSSHTSSPVVSSGVASQPLILSQGRSHSDDRDSPDENKNECPICLKIFKTAKAFERHEIVHIQEESMTADCREDLLAKSDDLAQEKLQGMLNVPVVDEFCKEKKMYIQALLSKVSEDSWVEFNRFIAERICIIFCKRSKVLPMRQHEVHLSTFIQWLGINIENNVIPSKLNAVGEAPEEILRNVSYRFATLLFESLAAYQVSLLVKNKSSKSSPSFELSWSQKQSLYYAVGYVVRKIRRKGCNNAVWERRVKCINERICFNSEEEYSEEFYKLKEWFDCLDRGGLVAVNERFFMCVMKIEEVIQSCFAISPTGVNKTLLIKELVKLENTFVLDLWYIITQGILTENDALPFFELFVSDYLKFSATAEAGLRKRDIEAQKGLQTVALRTDMKRNRARD